MKDAVHMTQVLNKSATTAKNLATSPVNAKLEEEDVEMDMKTDVAMDMEMDVATTEAEVPTGAQQEGEQSGETFL